MMLEGNSLFWLCESLASKQVRSCIFIQILSTANYCIFDAKINAEIKGTWLETTDESVCC